MSYDDPSDRIRSRGLFFRGSHKGHREIMQLVRTLPDYYLIFSKSSNLKLIIREGGW